MTKEQVLELENGGKMAHPRRFLSNDIREVGKPTELHGTHQKKSIYIMQNHANVIGSIDVEMNADGETTIVIHQSEGSEIKVVVQPSGS